MYSPVTAAWPGRSSSSVTLIAAMPAAQASGLPPKVDEWMNGFGSSTFQISGVDMDKGVTAEFIQLGGTKLNEAVPYRVILDRMSHEVPYYAVYLKMAALQGTYCINNTFWRSADDKFFGYAAAEKLGLGEPKTVVLPNYSYVDDVTAESLRNLWPTDFQMYLDYVGAPCIMRQR